MKLLYFLIPFLLFCALSYYIEDNKKIIEKESLYTSVKDSINKINNYPFTQKGVFTTHKIIAELDSKKHNLSVKQNISWVNKSNYSTNKIYFKFDINALKNNLSEYATKNFIKENEKSGLRNLVLSVNGEKRELNYTNLITRTLHDSTVAFVNLSKTCNPGDTISINATFNIDIPNPSLGIGYVQNREFYFINDWYIKIPPFIDGKWHAYPTPGFINYFDDFSSFNLSITIPNNYKIGASLNITNKIKNKSQTTYLFNSNRLKSFSWFCGPKMINKNFVYHGVKNDIGFSIFVQPEKENRINRYKTAIINSLNYLEQKLGYFPYNNFTLVDLPRTFPNTSHSFSNLALLKTNLFSPEKSLEPEFDITYILSKQYFDNIICVNSITEPWVTNGFAKYYSTKILEKYYSKASYSFKIAAYVPIYGLNFISYNEIPLIYSLGNFEYSPFEYYLPNYYNNHSVGSINNTSYEFPNKESYFVMSTIKPELAFLTLEKIIGKNDFDLCVKEFYNQNKFKYTSGNNFIKLCKNKNPKLKIFFDNVFNKAAYFDYRIKYVKKINKNNYDVYAERLGDGIFYNKVALYTNKDTIYQNWSDDNKWKIFRFTTKNEVIGAEIDPDKINLLDINTANNSFLLNSNYLFPFSLTMRWFFWIQNALMILGSIV
jgi:hypothetical protein